MEKDFKKKEINADEKVINIHDKISYFCPWYYYTPVTEQ